MRFEARDGMGGPADYQLERTGVGEPAIVTVNHLVFRTTNRAGIDLVAGITQGNVDAMNMGRLTIKANKPRTTNPK